MRQLKSATRCPSPSTGNPSSRSSSRIPPAAAHRGSPRRSSAQAASAAGPGSRRTRCGGFQLRGDAGLLTTRATRLSIGIRLYSRARDAGFEGRRASGLTRRCTLIIGIEPWRAEQILVAAPPVSSSTVQVRCPPNVFAKEETSSDGIPLRPCIIARPPRPPCSRWKCLRERPRPPATAGRTQKSARNRDGQGTMQSKPLIFRITDPIASGVCEGRSSPPRCRRLLLCQGTAWVTRRPSRTSASGRERQFAARG